jgi:hypothetical protein
MSAITTTTSTETEIMMNDDDDHHHRHHQNQNQNQNHHRSFTTTTTSPIAAAITTSNTIHDIVFHTKKLGIGLSRRMISSSSCSSTKIAGTMTGVVNKIVITRVVENNTDNNTNTQNANQIDQIIGGTPFVGDIVISIDNIKLWYNIAMKDVIKIINSSIKRPLIIQVSRRKSKNHIKNLSSSSDEKGTIMSSLSLLSSNNKEEKEVTTNNQADVDAAPALVANNKQSNNKVQQLQQHQNHIQNHNHNHNHNHREEEEREEQQQQQQYITPLQALYKSEEKQQHQQQLQQEQVQQQIQHQIQRIQHQQQQTQKQKQEQEQTDNSYDNDNDNDDDDDNVLKFDAIFNTRQLGLDVESGGNNNNDDNDNDNGVIVAVTRVKNEEYKDIIHPGDILISIGRIQLKNNRSIKSIDDVITLISSTTARPIIIEFARYRKRNRKRNQNQNQQIMDHGGYSGIDDEIAATLAKGTNNDDDVDVDDDDDDDYCYQQQNYVENESSKVAAIMYVIPMGCGSSGGGGGIGGQQRKERKKANTLDDESIKTSDGDCEGDDTPMTKSTPTNGRSCSPTITTNNRSIDKESRDVRSGKGSNKRHRDSSYDGVDGNDDDDYGSIQTADIYSGDAYIGSDAATAAAAARATVSGDSNVFSNFITTNEATAETEGPDDDTLSCCSITI